MKRLRLTKIIASSLVAVSILALNPIGASAEWKQDSNGWWYSQGGSSYATNWTKINEQWYYFYSDGYMAHDTKIDGYYLNSAGAWTTSIPAATTSYTDGNNSGSTASAVSNNQSQTVYSEPATGDMEGWQKLRGHKYENIAEIYFKLDGSNQSVQVKGIRKIDLNKFVEWVDDNGIKRVNTVGQIYQLFKYSNTYTTDWFSNKFGSLYGDWLMVSSIDGDYIVSDYLETTGKIPKKSNITLTPDAEVKSTEVEKKDISTEDVIKNIDKYMEKESKYEVSK